MKSISMRQIRSMAPMAKALKHILPERQIRDGDTSMVMQDPSRRVERSPVATVVRAGSAAPAGLAIHAVLAFHNVPRAVPEVFDATEVVAEAARWAVDIFAGVRKRVAPGIAVHRAGNAG